MLTAAQYTRPAAPPCGSGTISYSKSAGAVTFVGPCSFCGGDSECSRCKGTDWLSVEGDDALDAAIEAIRYARTPDESRSLGRQLASAAGREHAAFFVAYNARPFVCVNHHAQDIQINGACAVCEAPLVRGRAA